MALKKIINDKPKVGDKSQYNFPEFTDINPNNFTYNDSTGLPKNNDKFQNKDLFTNCVGDELNEKIIEANLNFQGDPYIKIDNLYISNTGVDGTTKSNHVTAWIFSQEAYGGDPTKDGYSALKSKLWDDDNEFKWKFYSSGFGSKGQGTDIGNIENVEGNPIVSNFGAEVSAPTIGDFDGKADEFIVKDDGSIDAFELSNLEPNPSQTTIFNESQYNPIYIVVWMRGHKKVAWPVNTDERKRRYDIFKISNEDLFSKSGNNYVGQNYSVNFTGATKSRTGDGGGGARQAAWKVTSLNLSINTSAGEQNNFSGVSNYKQFIDQVLPKSKIDENVFNSVQWLSSLNPATQLDNNEDSGETGALERHPDFIPFTTFGFSQNNQLGNNYVDLQSYNTNPDLIMKASVPLNVTFNIDIKKTEEGYPTLDLDKYDDESGFRSFYYFVIDWNDTEEKFKTIDDWLDSKPENNFDYLEKQNQNLYKLKSLNEPTLFDTSYLETLPFPTYLEEVSIVDDSTYPKVEYITLDGINFVPYKVYGDINGDTINRWRELGRNDIADYLFYNAPNANHAEPVTITSTQAEAIVNDWESGDQSMTLDEYILSLTQYRKDIMDFPLAPVDTQLRDLSDFMNPTLNPSQTGFVSNIYTTPGIKNIKYIIFSVYDGDGSGNTSPEFEVGRWKLCTSRIYLDIPPNQYPDFSDIGGSNYTTLPWPFTTPIIGGVSEDSKYKKSIQNTLGGGKVGDFDIIDEKLLVNDLENDEMGKNIETMDLEQCRYFNTSYGMYDLLGINPITSDGFRPYNFSDGGNLINNGDTIEWLYPDLDVNIINMPSEISSISSVMGGTEGTAVYNEDLNLYFGSLQTLKEGSSYIFNLTTESIIWNFPGSNKTIYWDGDINKFSEESSVGQIFIGDNSDLDLKQSCKLELNTGELTGKSILDTSGNSNKGLLIGDYKVKKVKKGQSMRKDSFIKVPKKKSNRNGAL